LNGLYQNADTNHNYDTASQGIFWADDDWQDYDYSLKSVQIMIRTKQTSVVIKNK